MNVIHRHISDLTKKYSTSFYDLKTRLFFVRGLYLYLLIKIVLSWNASILVGEVITFEPIESFPINWLFSLGNLFERAPVIFLVLGVVLSAVSILRPNYIISSILFWYMLNYFRVHYSLINGSDIVLVTLTLLATGLSIFPRWKRWSGFQMLLFNGTSFLIKIQIAIIYLLSGVDKLYSSAWRSGEAIQYMMSLDYLFNPSLTGVFTTISWLSYSVGWLVILFEILFPVLVWTTRFRIWILGAGVLFHIAIIMVLSLIDFGLIMIVTYLIFLKDEDFKKLGGI